MTLERVEELFGSPGEEISFKEIPQVPLYARFKEAAEGWLGVVWGDRCYRWTKDDRWSGDRTIYVGISEGRVVSKYLIELSL